MKLRTFHWLVARDKCGVCDSDLQFTVCGSCPRVYLVCCECESTWPVPGPLDETSASSPKSPDFVVPGTDCTIATFRGARPATREELNAAGLIGWIGGESTETIVPSR